MWKGEGAHEGDKRENDRVRTSEARKSSKEGTDQGHVERSRGHREDEDGDELRAVWSNREPVGEGVASVCDAGLEGRHADVELEREADDL